MAGTGVTILTNRTRQPLAGPALEADAAPTRARRVIARSGIRTLGQPMRTPRPVGLVEPRRPFGAGGNVAVAVPARITNARMIGLGTPTIAVAPALLDGLAVF